MTCNSNTCIHCISEQQKYHNRYLNAQIAALAALGSGEIVGNTGQPQTITVTTNGLQLSSNSQPTKQYKPINKRLLLLRR